MKMSSSSSMALLFITAAMVIVLVSSYTIESYKTSKPIIWRPQGDCYKSIPDCRLKLCDKRCKAKGKAEGVCVYSNLECPTYLRYVCRCFGKKTNWGRSRFCIDHPERCYGPR